MKTRYPSNNDAVAAIFAAGTDVDCGSFMKQNACTLEKTPPTAPNPPANSP